MDNNIRILKIKNGEGSPIEYPLGMVTSVKGEAETSEPKIGDVTITKEDIGLDKVENTVDAEKTVKNVGHKLTIGKQNYDGSNNITVEKEDISAALGYVPAGGENLLLNTGGSITLHGGIYTHVYAKYEISDKLLVGEKFTFSMDVKITSNNTDRVSVVLYDKDISIRQSNQVDANIINGRIICNIEPTGDNAAQLLVYPGTVGHTTNIDSVISKAKLEPGLVTDPVWTPAPEDLVLKGEVDGRNRLQNSLDPVFGTYGGSTVNVEKNKTVSEWGADNAIRVYGTKGNDNIVTLINTGSKPIPYGTSLCSSIYIKNDGGHNIRLSDASVEPYVTIAPGEIRRYYVSRKINENTYLAQFLFSMVDTGGFDFTIWHPKIEFGDTPTEWTPAPEDVVVRSELEDRLGFLKYYKKIDSGADDDNAAIELENGTYIMFCTQGAALDMLGIYLIGKTSYDNGCKIYTIFASDRLKQEGIIRYTADKRLVVASSYAGYIAFLYKVVNI